MLLELATAKIHLRVDGTAEDLGITLWSRAAEKMAAKFINRQIFETADAMAAAIALVPETLTDAAGVYDAAVFNAASMSNALIRSESLAYATSTFRAVQTAARQVRSGVVIDDLLRAAMLLILGHLYANRENVVVGTAAVPLPMGAERLLIPYRVEMGI